LTSSNVPALLGTIADPDIRTQVTQVTARCLTAPLNPSGPYFTGNSGVYFCLQLTSAGAAGLLSHQPVIGEFYFTLVDEVTGTERTCMSPLPQPIPVGPPPPVPLAEMLSTLHWVGNADGAVHSGFYRSLNGMLLKGYL